MMREHCDRCDKLCDSFPTWVDLPFVYPDGSVDEVRKSSWSVTVDDGCGNKKMLCRACYVTILKQHVAAMKLEKASTGGHLLACRWDSEAKRYVCAEGCWIKSINDGAAEE